MTVYALAHPDGRFLYFLPAPEGQHRRTPVSITADGQPMTRLREKNNAGWWVTDHQAEQIVATYQPPAKLTSYELRDMDALSARYPAKLTVDEWDAHPDNSDHLYSLYRCVTQDQPAIEHVYDGPYMVLEGREPPGPGELPWKAQLPYELAERPEYLHLFPGYIPGLRAHLHELIKKMPRVEHCFDGYQNVPGLHITLAVPYDPPATAWVSNYGARGQELKSGRTIQQRARRTLLLPVAPNVAADNYAQALEAWEQQVAYWVGQVEAASVTACGHCHGSGQVPTGTEKYSKK